MSRMIRERNKLKEFKELLGNRGVKVDFDNGILLFDDLAEFFTPTTLRSPDDILQAAHAKMLEVIDILEEGEPLNVRAMMEKGGLDPKNRSDLARTRLFLKECDLLQYTGGEPGRWIKQIVGPKTKGREAAFVNDTE